VVQHNHCGTAIIAVKGLDRKQRFDMNKNGLEIKAVCVVAEKESSLVPENANSTGA
jgi:hypothetical protein